MELVTVGTTVGATVPATLEHTLCNALIDTGTTRSCLSEEYYQQLFLPGLKPVHKLQVRTASGSSLCPTGTVTCDFKLVYPRLRLLKKVQDRNWLEPNWKVPIGFASASAG